ncbi:LCP family protein [Faecalibacillus faecis]|uniref:LCP family protein n=1 Tax=Faecalibacillus faecis TaxID=1982628 RepID=UPI002F93C8D1
MKALKKIISWPVVLTIQVLSSVALLFLLFKLGVVPTKYMVILVAVLAVLALLMYFFMKPAKGKHAVNARQSIGKIISLVLSIVLLIGSVYVAKGSSTLNKISGADKTTVHYAVLVLKDSKIDSLSDLKNESIEYNLQYDDKKDMNQIIAKAKQEQSSISYDETSDDYSKLADDLYNNTVHAILVNTAYNGMFEEAHENFANETKEIWTDEVDTEVKSFAKDVDVTSKPFTIYISGIDTYGKVSTVSRSDVNMIVTVNPKTKQILMSSIPRDYYVTLANKGKKDKLTHSGLAGPENTVKTMDNFLGIDINYYARVNFTSLITMVDALGGIDLDSDSSFSTMGYSFTKGVQHVNGEKALAFARERHSFADGDNMRVKHQQDVLMAMLKKMMSPAIITNYTSVLNSVAGSFETNMDSSDITGLIKMQINDMASWTFTQKQFTGHGVMQTGGAYMPSTKLYYMIPDDSSVSENIAAIKAVLNGQTVE